MRLLSDGAFRCERQQLSRSISTLYSKDHFSVEVIEDSFGSDHEDILVRVGPTPVFSRSSPFPSNYNYDIDRVDVQASPQERTDILKGNLLPTSPDSVIMKIAWSGYKISDGDELYHTVWENASGVVDIKRPSEVPHDLKFELHSFNFEHVGRVGQTSVDHWLFKARTSPILCELLMSEEEYTVYTCGLEISEVDEYEGYGGSGKINDMERLMKEMSLRSGKKG